MYKYGRISNSVYSVYNKYTKDVSFNVLQCNTFMVWIPISGAISDLLFN